MWAEDRQRVILVGTHRVNTAIITYERRNEVGRIQRNDHFQELSVISSVIPKPIKHSENLQFSWEQKLDRIIILQDFLVKCF